MRLEFTQQELAETCNTFEGLQREYGPFATAVKIALSTLHTVEGSPDTLPNVSSRGGTTVIRTSTAEVVFDLSVNNGTATIYDIHTRPFNSRR